MGQQNTKISAEEINGLIKKTKYTKDDMDRLLRDYKEYSVSGDKKIGFSEAEFLEFFKIRFREWNTESMKAMFSVFDSDKNGTIDFKEFVTALYLMTKAPVAEKCGIIFDIFDEDKSGYLSEKEVEKLVSVATNCCCALGGGKEGVEYICNLFAPVYSQEKGLSRDQYLKIASTSDRFVRLISFYDSIGDLLY